MNDRSCDNPRCKSTDKLYEFRVNRVTGKKMFFCSERCFAEYVTEYSGDYGLQSDMFDKYPEMRPPLSESPPSRYFPIEFLLGLWVFLAVLGPSAGFGLVYLFSSKPPRDWWLGLIPGLNHIALLGMAFADKTDPVNPAAIYGFGLVGYWVVAVVIWLMLR